MKISTLSLFILLVFQAACTENQIRNIHLEGDLVAKEIHYCKIRYTIRVQFT